MSKFTDMLIAALTGPIEIIATEKLAELLRKIEPKESRDTILVSLYAPIDVELEKLTAGTKTGIDDAIVGAMKAAIEKVAEEDGIELPNLDND